MSKMIRFVMRKFQRNKDRQQKWKPPKPMEINEPNATTKKLTDLDDDCLEHIFMYLSLADLLSVVNTNKRLTTAAELAFVRNFGRREYVFSDITISKKKIIKFWFDGNEQVELANPYRLLRCFGHLISKLNVTVMHKQIAYKAFKYVNKYCTETATEIKFHLNKDLNCVNKPYPNAETVTLYVYYSEKLLRTTKQLNKLFPNVRNLSIDYCKFEREYIAVHFPLLNQLKLTGSPGSKGIYKISYLKNTYAEMLRLNPQLRSLKLCYKFTEILLRSVSQHLQSLVYLEITLNYDDSRSFGDEVINFPSLNELKIWYFSAELIKISISATSLEAFSFEYWSEFNMNFLLDFLNNHPTITRFNVTDHCEHLRTTNFFIDVTAALPFLEEVNFSSISIPVNDAIRFVANCKSLKKFCFKTDCNVDVNHLKARTGAKCHVVCTKVNELKRYKLYCITIVDNLHSTI